MQFGHAGIKKAAPLLIIAVLAIGGFAVLIATRTHTPPIAEVEREWTVETMAAAIGQHVPVLTLLGSVESSQAVQLRAAITADVGSVLVNEGDQVAAGAPLLELDDKEVKLQLQQREAELAEVNALLASEQSRYDSDQTILQHEQELLSLAQQELARAQSLKRDRLASQTRIDEAQQTVLRQQIAVNQRQLAIQDHAARKAKLEAQAAKAAALRDQARLDVQHSRLHAPFAARITRLVSAPGDRVRPGDTLLELYNIQAMQVRAQIPTPQLAALEAALATAPSLNASAQGNGQLLGLTLSQLSGDIKQGRGGRDALFAFRQTYPQIVAGQVLSIHLRLPAVDDSIAIPRQAVYGADRIYTVAGGRLKGHTIQRLGETSSPAGHRLVLARSTTLGAEDRIVITQLPNAMDGLKVRMQGR
jgi:multidrug efflux pump subunit AcrA (membrane-fusion protein)